MYVEEERRGRTKGTRWKVNRENFRKDKGKDMQRGRTRSWKDEDRGRM